MRLQSAAIFVLLSAVAAVRAESPSAPPWLPRYDLAINLDVESAVAQVNQQVVWVNRSSKPITEIVFNVHSHYQPPKNPLDRMLIAKMLEIMKIPAREGIFDEPAFQIGKVEQLHPHGREWRRTELNHAWRRDIDTALTVELPEPLAPGDSVSLALEYSLKLPKKQGRWGQWRGVTFLTNWHPVVAFHDEVKGWQPTPFVPWHQPFFNEAGVFRVRVNLPADHLIACTGPVTERTEHDGRATYRIGPVTARDWSMTASARYKEFTETTSDKVTVRCVAFEEHEHYAKVLIKNAARAIENYSKWFGRYPYPDLNIAESYFGWNGNECCGMILIDERVFSMPHFAEGYVEYLISHEVAHQWWYNIIGSDGFRETFMDEAFATYFAHRLLNQYEGKNNSLLQFPKGLGWLPGIRREDYRYGQFYATLHNGELAPPLQEMTKYRHVGNLFSAAYDRGGKIVGMVEDRLGETSFLDFIRRLYGKYYFRVLSADQFRKELEEYTGRSWDDFFRRWLMENGMTDWSIESVDFPAVEQAGAAVTESGERLVRATVTLKQRAENDEATVLGFSYDGGQSFPVRVPISRKHGRMTFDHPVARVEPDGELLKVDIVLPGKPDQIAVDPDQILPDREPANNFWKPRVRFKATPFYTMLEETNFTTAYDRWNIIMGPWVYGPSYADPWFTRSNVVGFRTGFHRTEEFNGGVYTGFRPSFRDIAVGFDATIPHWPMPRTEVGIHGEKSLIHMFKSNPDPDRASIYLRHIIDESPSLYAAPMHHVEVYGAWQRNFLPTPRATLPQAIEFRQNTNVGIHYHLDLQTPYWDAESGFRLDATYAVGIPIFGQDRSSQQAAAQVSVVQAPPEGLGWWSDTRFAVRAYGAWASPSRARLYSLGGDLLFRGFDMAERQGSLAWVGSVEWRLPLVRHLDADAFDRFLRLKNLYVAPFYDIGDIYLDGRSLGPTAHAFGMGLRFDIAWFSFLERTMFRLDVAKAVNVSAPVQFWLGITHPF